MRTRNAAVGERPRVTGANAMDLDTVAAIFRRNMTRLVADAAARRPRTPR
jgi:hypothetical protein